MEEYSNGLIIFVSALIPTLITLWLNERVKGSVKNSFDEKLAQFQIELNHLKSKENFKFTKLHEKRLEVLQQTFQFLNENLTLLSQYTSPIKFTPKEMEFNESEQLASVKYREAYNAFLNYFNYNVIYFDEDDEKLLRSFFAESADIFNAYDTKQSIIAMGGTPEKQDYMNAATAHKKIPETIYPLKKEIEIKFRKLLGE